MHNPTLPGSRRMVSGVQALVLVLIFLLCTAVLFCVFSAAFSMSRQAKQINDSTQLCRNAADAFCICPTAEATTQALGATDAGNSVYFDENLTAVSSSDAVYRLDLEVTTRQTGAGRLHLATFCVYSGQTCLYRLQTQVYTPQQEAVS